MKAINRKGQTAGKFTVTRMVVIPCRALCHYVCNVCGFESSDPVRWSLLRNKRCPGCYALEVERNREEKKTRRQKPYVPMDACDKDIDRVYRHFVSMPTHELNNRWNDA